MRSQAQFRMPWGLGLVVAALFGFTPTAFAATCSSMTPVAVQTEYDGAVLVQFSNGSWHVAAAANDTAARDRLSILLAAYLGGKKVTLQWSGSHSCTTTDYNNAAFAVRIND